MYYILTVYSKSAYREYLLPRQREGTWEVLLPGTEFDRAEDIPLSIAYRDGCPEFLPSGMFTLRPARGNRRFPLPVEAGKVYFLSPDSGGRLVLTVRETQRLAPVFQVYSLDTGTPITIGASAENLIVYDNGSTVSGVHAVITMKDGCGSLVDKSCNGIYINQKRVDRSSALRFGDRIYILGLLIIYLENCIALDTSVSGLRIRDRLIPLKGDAADSMLTAALNVYNSAERGTVLETGSPEENETVLLSEALPDEEDATVLERTPYAKDETVLESLTNAEDETVLERLAYAEDETVLERLSDAEDETVLESLPHTEDETVLESLPHTEDETVLERLTDGEDETVLEESEQTGNGSLSG